MYCGNCGRKIEDNASFCPECGMEIKIVHSKKNKENLIRRKGKKQLVILFIVFVFIFILAGASVLFKVVKDKQYKNSMDMGKKYLEEQQYEKAINSFDEAIKCSNMEVEPYWNKAKTYIEMGNAEQAGQTYSQVLDVLINKIVREDEIPEDTEEICKEIIAFWGNLDTIQKEERLVEIESVLSKIDPYIDNSIREELYFEKVIYEHNGVICEQLEGTYLSETQKSYGQASAEPTRYALVESDKMGVVFYEKGDFNSDGRQELVIVYPYIDENGAIGLTASLYSNTHSTPNDYRCSLNDIKNANIHFLVNDKYLIVVEQKDESSGFYGAVHYPVLDKMEEHQKSTDNHFKEKITVINLENFETVCDFERVIDDSSSNNHTSTSTLNLANGKKIAFSKGYSSYGWPSSTEVIIDEEEMNEKVLSYLSTYKIDNVELQNITWDDRNTALKVDTNSVDNITKISFMSSKGTIDESDIYNVKVTGTFTMDVANTTVEEANNSTLEVTDLSSVYSEGSMTSIIDADGNLIMCGLNTDGQVGSKIPEKVTTYSLVATDVKYVCGTSNLAIITKDNKLYAKEYDGLEMFLNEKNADIEIYKVADDVLDAEVWGDVCAYVTNNGELYAMGSPRGSLGDKNNTKWTAEPIKIMDNIRDIELSTNNDYATTFAAITTDNKLYMWGSNSSHIIKESNEDDVNKPLLIMENVKQVSLGEDYVLTLTTDNIAYAWGANHQGQLGIGNTDATEEVVKIMEDVIYIDAGVSSSLAVTKNGELYTWGSNNYGCAGVGGDDNVKVESPVAIMDNVRTASIDGETMIILDNDGNVYTCGWNSEGQLGTGDFNDSNVPVKVYNIYESDLPGTLNDINGEIIDETYFDTMNETKIEVETNGQNLVVNMTIDHLSDFLKYNDNSISLLISDGIQALKFRFAVENNTAALDDSIYILTENGGTLYWMGKYWESISCEQNTNILSWNCEIPVNSFSAENIKYISAEIFTSRHRKHVTTYELNEEQLILTDKSIENIEMAVSSSSYHQYIEE